jgi:hypothetical protein
MVDISGTEAMADAVTWEFDTWQEEGIAHVDVTFELGALKMRFSFTVDQAEQFVVQFRDEIVGAKQKELEWKTNTDTEEEADV